MSAADDALRTTIGEMATRAHYETMRAGREKLQRSAPLWRRVTDGSPCGFCAMVASRGPVYGSERAAGDGNRYHGHCGCTVEPYFGDPNDWEPSAEEARFLEAYQESYYTGIPTDELSSAIEAWLAAHPLADDVAEALTDWASAKSPAEVGAMLQQALGDRAKVFGFDDDKLDLGRTQSMARHITALFDEFPEVRADVGIANIPNPLTLAQAGGFAGPGGTWTDLTLTVSRDQMRTVGSRMVSGFERSVRSGHFHVVRDGVDVVENTIAHEFGHLVDYTTFGKVAGPIKGKASSNEVLRQLAAETGTSPAALRKAQMSGYAHTNRYEAIAEAFSDVRVNGDDAFELSKRIYAELLRRLRSGDK